MKFNLALKNITDVQTFLSYCNKLQTSFSEKTASGILEFACTVATLKSTPAERVQTFANTVERVLALIDEDKAERIAEGGDAREWGFELCFDCDGDYKGYGEIRRGNNIVYGVGLFICEEYSEIYDWTKR